MFYRYGLHREPSFAESTDKTPVRYRPCVIECRVKSYECRFDYGNLILMS